MHHARASGLLVAVALVTASPAHAQRRPARRMPAPAAAAPSGDPAALRTCAAVRATFAPVTSTRRDCPEIACSDGVSVDLGEGVRGPGLYRFEIVADGQRFACEQRLPYATCDVPNPCVWRLRGTWGGVSVTQTNCARPAAEHGFSTVEFRDVCPVSLRVSVSRDGRPLGAWTATPTYRRLVPGGEGCGMMCATGDDVPRGR